MHALPRAWAPLGARRSEVLRGWDRVPPGGLDLHALREMPTPGGPAVLGSYADGTETSPPWGLDLHALRRPWALLDVLGPKALHQTALFPKASDLKGLYLTWFDPKAFDTKVPHTISEKSTLPWYETFPILILILA